MRIIVITPPDFVPNEAQTIVRLLQKGAWAVHVRKPQASADRIQTLLEEVPVAWRGSLVLHDHFELALPYGLKGVHLNGRNPIPPDGWQGSVSCSTHSVEELSARLPQVDYAFLSPVYDSISKQGYGAAYSAQELLAAQHQGMINERVIALGGVGLDRLEDVRRYGFGGAALLGDVWQRVDEPTFEDYLEELSRRSML